MSVKTDDEVERALCVLEQYARVNDSATQVLAGMDRARTGEEPWTSNMREADEQATTIVLKLAGIADILTGSAARAQKALRLRRTSLQESAPS
jgi:hypothetical protein